jgi:hypothetical protein
LKQFAQAVQALGAVNASSKFNFLTDSFSNKYIFNTRKEHESFLR